jgi:hypothetical protein
VDIDGISLAVDASASMKRIRVLLVIVAVLAAFVLGIIWKIARVDECFDQGGVAPGGLRRGQHCFGMMDQ